MEASSAPPESVSEGVEPFTVLVPFCLGHTKVVSRLARISKCLRGLRRHRATDGRIIDRVHPDRHGRMASRAWQRAFRSVGR